MSLFEDPSNIELSEEPVGPGATTLRSFAISEETEILSGLSDVVSKTPFRHMITPGGSRMSVAMTNCGALGWVTDRTGSRTPQRGHCRDHFVDFRIVPYHAAAEVRLDRSRRHDIGGDAARPELFCEIARENLDRALGGCTSRAAGHGNAGES